MKIISANEILDESRIDKSMTLDRFKRLRKHNHIDIEKYLYRERYREDYRCLDI